MCLLGSSGASSANSKLRLTTSVRPSLLSGHKTLGYWTDGRIHVGTMVTDISVCCILLDRHSRDGVQLFASLSVYEHCLDLIGRGIQHGQIKLTLCAADTLPHLFRSVRSP